MTMSKGGVGKTTVAARIAGPLAQRGFPIALTTTDPVAHVEQAAPISEPVSPPQVRHAAGTADALCAALCAFILKNVERFSRMLSFRYESASVEVRAEREEPPARIARLSYQLRIVTDAPAARVQLLHKSIRKFGTITNTLGAACDLNGGIEAVAPRGAS